MISKTFPQFNVRSLNYGIDQLKFSPGVKIKNSFIYSSFPNRGLLVLLKMWPRILKILPDAVLNVYSDLNGEWVNNVAPEQMKAIKELIPSLTGVTVHSWVSKSDLANAFKTADYWLYPCTFEETFCLTALEAAISKTCVISNGLAALEETVGDRGFIVNGDPSTQFI
jgi:glycosyltransferase involved in cell wall biosynthesis